jgi:sugar O-acyltransferase (sialic acid O-acetyltransferase NeuD family)
MSSSAIVLIGAGGHARSCIDVIEHEGRFEILGLVGLPEEVGTRVLGYPVLGSDHELPELVARAGCALVSVGQITSPMLRMKLFDQLRKTGCDLPVIVSPRAHVSRHARVGAGSIVMHGAVINAAAVVGRNCIINSQSLIEHDVSVGDHCHIATAAVLNSAVRVGAASFIGSGTTVRQGLTIGERCVIGMSQRVLADCDADTRLPPARLS